MLPAALPTADAVASAIDPPTVAAAEREPSAAAVVQLGALERARPLRFASIAALQLLGLAANIAAVAALFAQRYFALAFVLIGVQISSSIMCICAVCVELRQRRMRPCCCFRFLLASLELLVFGVFQFIQVHLVWRALVEPGRGRSRSCFGLGGAIPDEAGSAIYSESSSPTSRDRSSSSASANITVSRVSSEPTFARGNDISTSANVDSEPASSRQPALVARANAANQPLLPRLQLPAAVPALFSPAMESVPSRPRSGRENIWFSPGLRPRYFCRGIDGVFEGVAQAGVLFFAFVSGRVRLDDSYIIIGVYVVSGSLSMLSATLALMEVDSWVSSQISSNAVRRGNKTMARHACLRMTEIGSRIWVLVTLTVLARRWYSDVAMFALFVVSDYIATILVVFSVHGMELTALLIGFPLVAANVVRFIDIGGLAVSAKRVTRRLAWVRLVEGFGALIGLLLYLQEMDLQRPLWPVKTYAMIWLIGALCVPLYLILEWLGPRRHLAEEIACSAARAECAALARLLAEAENASEEKAGINRLGRDGFAPLHLAAMAGSTQAVKMLLRARAEIALPSSAGETALMLAAAAGQDETLRSILRRGGGGRGLASASVGGDTALHLAWRHDHSACVHTLLRARADPNQVNARGIAAVAVAGGYAEASAAHNVADASQYSQKSNDDQAAESTLHIPLQSVSDDALEELLGEASMFLRLESPGSAVPTSTCTEAGSTPRFGTPRRSRQSRRVTPRNVPQRLSWYVAAANPGALGLVMRAWSPEGSTPGVCENSSRQSESNGAISFANFRIEGKLGEGNFGTVYLARDLRSSDYSSGSTSNDGLIALKILKRKQYRVQDMMDRAWQEHHVLKVANHPCIVRLVCAFVTPAKEVALAMEYCPRGTLSDIVVREGQPGLLEPFVRIALAEVVLALRYLHEDLDVVFRDLKPENVVFSSSMCAKLTDFGLAKANATESGGVRSFVGSKQYVAPEVTEGIEPYGYAVDIYALGLVAWICITGGIRVSEHELEGGWMRVPPPSHALLRTWISQQRSHAGGGLGRTSNVSAQALDFIDQLTLELPAARGTSNSVRFHPFFASGSNPLLASEEDWAAMLQRATELARAPQPTASSSVQRSVVD